MTGSDAHRSLGDDAEASLRAEMLVQLVAGQFALEAAIADLGNADPATRNRLHNRLSLISGLRQQVGTAQSSALTALREQVVAIAGNASAAAQDARTSAAASASSADVATLALAARQQASSVMAGMKDFDAQLHFGPGDTEADYRKREAERRAYIVAEQAKHTPQGDLNASGAAVGQMVDAKAHGAGGPEFEKRWDALATTTERLREAAKVNGISTDEFDHRLSEDLRRILKSKGLSDAEIDAQFAAHPNAPLEAAKAYVKGDADLAKLQRSAERVNAISGGTTGGQEDDIKGLIASLQTAGVVVGVHDAASQPTHGVAMAAITQTTRSV